MLMDVPTTESSYQFKGGEPGTRSVRPPKFNSDRKHYLRRNATRFAPLESDPRGQSEVTDYVVEVLPANGVRRRKASWPGMAVEIVQATGNEPIAFRFRAPVHLLALFEHGTRREGETSVEGMRSSLRDLTRKLTFIPAGREYRDNYVPRSPLRVVFFYLAPDAMPLADSREIARPSFDPRLFFEDATLLSTAQKLTASIEGGAGPDSDDYLRALGHVLAHELVRPHRGATASKRAFKGGLAAWQQRLVASHIDENLAEPIPLATLAELVGLSTYHFCRVFKQSFGIPPHRYHTSRRIERAKALLARPAPSVTEIGMAVGFSETSSFTAAFRKATGLTPTAYHRSLA